MKKAFTEKLWKIMKISLAQGIIAIVISGMAVAHDNNAQLLERKISVTVHEQTLENALRQIGLKSNVTFVYSTSHLNVEAVVSIQSEDQTLGELLDELLGPLNISFKVYNKDESITLKQRRTNVRTSPSLPSNSVEDANDRHRRDVVSGIVRDAATGQVLAGVNVIVKGTTNGTSTDGEGKFSLEAEPNDILVFSFIGFTSIEAGVANKTTMDISLQEEISALNEVVVNAGYWEVKRKEQTGNISQITFKEISQTPVSNPLQAIQGRMAGVYVQQTTGVAGGGFNIQIRGQNSLRNLPGNTGNNPLYIVDGVPFTAGIIGSTSMGNSIVPLASPLSTINPDDIESIEVLKDADATAIYGSRGANGVVLIRTKKAKAGGTQLDVSLSAGAAQVPSKMDLLSSDQYNTMRREAFRNDNYEQFLVPQFAVFFPDVMIWDTTRYTDWQEELIGGTAGIVNAQATLSGGSENTRFSVGGGFYKEGSVFPGDFGYKRGSGLTSLQHLSRDKRFSFHLNTSYSFTNNNLPSLDLTDQAVSLPPVAPPLYDEAGNLNWANGTWTNPLAGLYKKYESKTQNLLVSSSISYSLMKGLALKGNIGYTSMSMDQFNSFPIKANNPTSSTATGSSTFGSGSIITWILEPQVEYETNISQGAMTVLIGSTFQQNNQASETISATGYTSDDLLENIQSAATVTVPNSSSTVYKYAGFFGRVNYNWREKYILNLTGRRDGSSRFGPDRRFANFGAVGAAWIFSEEDLLRNALPFLSFGKLRASYGITGSDQIGDYQYLATYSSTQFSYANVKGIIPNRLVNPDYGWESSRKLEAAFEWGIFKDRLHGSVSWFRNLSSDQLVGYPLPRATGQSSIQYNLEATVQNTGWEFEVTSTNIQTSSFRWLTSWNMTIPRNKLVNYPNIEASSYANTLEVGKSLYTKKLIHGTGVDPQTGLYIFEDINGNGTTLFDFPGDIQALKQVSQQFYGGLYNSFSFAGIEFGFLFQYVRQTGYNYMQSFYLSPGSASNQPELVMRRWQSAGNITDIQRFTQSYDAGGNMFSNATSADNVIGDASFIRLKNMSLSYSLPVGVTDKMKMKKAKIFLLAQNVLTFTGYEGLDPETQNSRILPPLRTITGGLQVSF
jgi:TonB-linked SusC/RagA family outer membrane protein